MSFSPEQHVPPSKPCGSGQAHGHRPEKVLTYCVNLSQVQVVGSTASRSPQTPQPVSVSKRLNTRRQDAAWISNKLDHLIRMDNDEAFIRSTLRSERQQKMSECHPYTSMCSIIVQQQRIAGFYLEDSKFCEWILPRCSGSQGASHKFLFFNNLC